MLNKDVAIKILHVVNDVTVQRFQREAQAVFNLHHENIVAVKEFGVTDEGQPYMVMEFIEGKTLAAVISERGALPLDLCTNIFKQVCNGISHAHSRGVLHRDLKPSNVMLTDPESWSPQVRIVDFGIAKVLDQDELEAGKLTRTGDFVGSPLYMSPEQCLGKNIDLRSDIYSIGCIMYEALTGQPPFSGGTQMEIMLKQMSDKAPSLKEKGGISYPVWVERLVARALAKDPDARFQTIDELKKSIEDRIVPEIKIQRQSAPNKNILPIAVGSGVVLLAVASGFYYYNNNLTAINAASNKASSKMPSQLLAEQFPELKIDKKAAKAEKPTELSGESFVTPINHDGIVEEDIENREITSVSNQNQVISDDALAGLKDRLDVKSLHLSEAGISDKALAPAAHLPLVAVELYKNPLITAKVLDYIRPEFMEELHLAKTGFRSSGIAQLSKYKNLRVLELSHDEIHDADLKNLAKLKNLITLDLSYNPITDAIFPVVANLSNLRDLALCSTNVTGKGIASLKGLKELRSLNLNRTKVDDSAISVIRTLPLTGLDLQVTGITNGAIKMIAQMKGLTQLCLQCIKLTPESMKSIASMKLTQLILYQCNLNDQSLAELGKCTTLRELRLSGNMGISSKGLAALKKLPLQNIELELTGITDADLPIFYDWKSLRSIDLERCHINDAAIKALREKVGKDCSVLPFDAPNISRINWGSPF